MDAGRDAVNRRSTATGRQLRRSLLALVAAVTVAGVLLAVQLHPDQARRNVRAPAATGTGTVPWVNTAPTYPHIPRHVVAPRPDPARAESLPLCTADDLAVVGERDGVGGGTWLLDVTLRLAGDRPPCRLSGHPRVVLLDHGRPAGVPVADTTDGSAEVNYRHPVRLDRRQPAVLTMTWAGMWCTTPVRNDQIRVVLGAGRGAFLVTGFRHSPGCDGDPGMGPVPVSVSSFAPLRYRPGRTESDYAGLDVRLVMPRHVHAGRRLDFTVTLTARRDLPLAPCPDYSINQYTRTGRATEDRYALNCRAVPYRDAAGRPYLPAGRQVRFAMHTVALGASHTVKFLWQLEVPASNAMDGAVI